MIIDSLDGIFKSAEEKGMWHRYYAANFQNATTSANITSGYQTWARCPIPLIIPSMGSGISGAWLTSFGATHANTSVLIGLEYSLGSLTVSTNTFAAGVSMPTKSMRLNGLTSSIATVSQYLFLVATTGLTAATPTVTITYTNQDGDTGQTATLTLPTNAIIDSAFSIVPHLASGDTGAKAITNLSISTGSAGVLKVFGVLELGLASTSGGGPVLVNSLITTKPLWLLETNDAITVYQSVNSIGRRHVTLSAVAEY